MAGSGNDISWLGTEELQKILQELAESQELELTIFAMIERKETEFSMVHQPGELQFRLQRLFERYEETIDGIQSAFEGYVEYIQGKPGTLYDAADTIDHQVRAMTKIADYLSELASDLAQRAEDDPRMADPSLSVKESGAALSGAAQAPNAAPLDSEQARPE
jgi:hypothetical protein